MSVSLEWKKMVAGPHKSAHATDPNGGYYCFHKSGNTEMTVFHMHPFYRMGIAKNVKEALAICQNHYEETNDRANPETQQ